MRFYFSAPPAQLLSDRREEEASEGGEKEGRTKDRTPEDWNRKVTEKEDGRKLILTFCCEITAVFLSL